MPNHPIIIDEWDNQWNDVDSKTYTLKTKIFSLDHEIDMTKVSTSIISDTLTATTLRIDPLIEKLLIRDKARTLFDMDKISKPELQRLLSMLDSVDEESIKLAVETINNM